MGNRNYNHAKSLEDCFCFDTVDKMWGLREMFREDKKNPYKSWHRVNQRHWRRNTVRGVVAEFQSRIYDAPVISVSPSYRMNNGVMFRKGKGNRFDRKKVKGFKNAVFCIRLQSKKKLSQARMYNWFGTMIDGPYKKENGKEKGVITKVHLCCDENGIYYLWVLVCRMNSAKPFQRGPLFGLILPDLHDDDIPYCNTDIDGGMIMMDNIEGL